MFAFERFKRLLAEKKTDRVKLNDFQMDLVSSDEFYTSDALFMIEQLIEEGLVERDKDSFLSLSISHS